MAHWINFTQGSEQSLGHLGYGIYFNRLERETGLKPGAAAFEKAKAYCRLKVLENFFQIETQLQFQSF